MLRLFVNYNYKKQDDSNVIKTNKYFRLKTKTKSKMAAKIITGLHTRASYNVVVYVLNMTDNLSKMFYLIQVASLYIIIF